MDTRVMRLLLLVVLALAGTRVLAQDADGGDPPDAAHATLLEPGPAAPPPDAGAPRRLSDLFGGPQPPSDAPPPVPVTYHEDTAFQLASPGGQRDAVQRA